MNEQITTAAEFDAMPPKALAENGPALIRKTEHGDWQTLGGNSGSFYLDSETIAAQGSWTILYRPDAPERTEPTEKQVDLITGALIDHRLTPNPQPPGWLCSCGHVVHELRSWNDTRHAFLRHQAEAVLALLPQRVAPSAEEIAELLRSWGVRSRHGEWSDAEAQVSAARDVARLYASAPAVAEVRAQALRDAADAIGDECASSDYMADHISDEGIEWWAGRLRARAERGEA